MRITLLVVLLLTDLAFAQSPRSLELSDAVEWNALRGPRLSVGGRYVMFEVSPEDGDDGTLVIQSTNGDWRREIPRGTGARFDFEERVAVCLVKPPREDDDDAEAKPEAPRGRRGGRGSGGARGGAEGAKNGLAIVHLGRGEVERIENVESFRLPAERGGFVAWKYGAAKPEKKSEATDEERSTEESKAGEGPGKKEKKEEREKQDEKEKKKEKKHEDGTDVVLRDLVTGIETRFTHVTSIRFAKNGSAFAFAQATKEDGGDGVSVVRLADQEELRVFEGEGDVKSLAFSDSGDRLAFLSNVDDYDAEAPAWALHLWDVDEPAVRTVAALGSAGLAEGFAVSEHRAPDFSDSAERLFFGVAPRPIPDPEEVKKDEKVTLDLWHWKDDVLMPAQLVGADRERRRSHLAVAHLGRDARLVVLGSDEVPEVSFDESKDGPSALGVSDRPYRRRSSWQSSVPRDVFLIDVETGDVRQIAEALEGRPRLSPGGTWVTWWDGEKREWFARSAAGGEEAGEVRGLTGRLGRNFHDVLNDRPASPRSAGRVTWLAGDVAMLIPDEHDLWWIDPSGAAPARCVTVDVGRRESLRFRIVDLDPENVAHAAEEELLLSALDLTTKESGFYATSVNAERAPELRVRSAHHYGTPIAARDADVRLYSRESFTEFGDLWVADSSFAEPRRVSDVNPQQAEFAWGNAESITWRSVSGDEVDGNLYTPDGFDPSGATKYPMLVYFYERSSDGLNRHHSPAPHRSTIRIPYYTSRDYVVFVPDIHYRVGFPGQSSLDAIVPGVLSVVERGFVDEKSIGVQGHSWGGYQIAWLVTRTDLFRAAVAGAPVANMTSAYGGIRYDSGMSRMFQYEQTQSRIGATLWEAPMRYLENSPVFYADGVETPLLVLHNDRDGAVPWTQGIEMFVALRRLGKPSWLLNYNGEKHGITKWSHKVDYARRLEQYFDHFLKGAPAPVWLEEGIPAVDKGRRLGFEPAGGVGSTK